MADGWSVGLTILIVVLAGCAGPLGQEPSEPTASTATTTGDSTASATASASPTVTGTPGAEERLPDGVTSSGIENASALLVAHVEALTATGYVMTGNGSATVRRQGIFVDVVSSQRNLVAPNASAYVTRRTVDAGPYGRERVAWANASVQFRRIVTNGEEKFSRGSPKTPDKLAGRGLLRPYLRGGNYTLVETERVDDGLRFTLRATGIANRTAAFNALPKEAEEITSFEATLVIDASGRIHSADATIGYVIGSRDAEQRMTYTLERTENVTVAEPDWLGSARNATSGG